MPDREEHVPTRPPATLRRLGLGQRLGAAVAAGAVALLLVGSQAGLVAMYSGEADPLLAALRPATPASQAVAAMRKPSRGL
jgi:hypothetical protein